MSPPIVPQTTQFPEDATIAATVFLDRAFEFYAQFRETEFSKLVPSESVAALEIRLPVAVSSPQFKKLNGGPRRYRQLGEMSHVVHFADEYQDGAAAELKRLQMDDWAYRNWLAEARRIMVAGAAVPDDALVDLLLVAHSTASWEAADGSIYLVDDAHPVNPLDAADLGASGSATWSNMHENLPLTYDNAKTLLARHDNRGAPGGQYRDDGPITHVVVGPDLWVTANNIFQRSRIVVSSGAGNTLTRTEIENDVFGYGIKVIKSRRMTKTGAWFPMSIDGMGAPWIPLDQVPRNNPMMPAGTSTSFVPATDGMPFEWIWEGPGSNTHINGDPATGLPPGFVRMSAKRTSACVMHWPAKIHGCYETTA